MTYTASRITELKENEIFVFGSNELGRHGKGAALDAMKWGAIKGQGAGLMGRTYGIPTKGYDMRQSLWLRTIMLYVSDFISFAVSRPDLTFLVTEIGCGLAGYSPIDIAPMFKKCLKMDNVILPQSFHKVLNP